MADELIRLDTTIIGIDSLINKALTAEEVKVLFTVKDVIHSQQRYFTDVYPVKHGHWIEEVREVGGFFKLYQTYIHCSECGKEHYSGTLPKPNFCDNCGADMRGEGNAWK